MSSFDLGEVALQYAARGLAVFPCGVKKKTPACKHWKEDASKDPASLISLWTGSAFNIGLPTGSSNGIWALDIDGETGAQSLAALVAEHGELPETPEQSTGTGRHIFFRHVDGIRPNAGVMAPGLDIRGEGGYVVVAPSIHPSGIAYAWHETRRPSAIPFADAPGWLVKLAIKEKPLAVAVEVPAPVTDGTERYVAAALIEESNKVARAGEGQRNDTLNQAAFSLGTLVGAGALQEHLAVGNLKASAAAAGLDPVEIEKTIASGMAAGRAQPRKMPEKKQRAVQKRERPALTVVASEGAPTGNEPPPDEDWMRTLIYKENGELADKLITNFCVHLTWHPDMAGLFAYDECADRVVLTRRPLWEPNHGEIWVPRSVQDVDTVRASSWLEYHRMKPRVNDVSRAIVSAAYRNVVNPPREYLSNLKWDGKPRIDNWLTCYLGVKADEYTKLVGAKWLISAISRVFNPGAQVDTMLIIEGPQGIGKSKALRVLATLGDQSYFTDDLSDLGNKDTIMQMQGVIIAEIAELAAMLKKDQEDVKAFLSRRVDRYRPPYGQHVVERPRRCVFAGTMNPGAINYLKDETGGRRFWPVRSTSVDAIALAKDRDQVWAEAVHRYRQNERYWLADEEIALAITEQEQRQEEDPWEQDINEIVATLYEDMIPAAFILRKLGLDTNQRNQAALKRLSKYMPKIGWHKAKQRVGGCPNPVSVYVRGE